MLVPTWASYEAIIFVAILLLHYNCLIVIKLSWSQHYHYKEVFVEYTMHDCQDTTTQKLQRKDT